MRWYRINIDYLYYETDKNALNISTAAGKTPEKIKRTGRKMEKYI